MASASYQQPSFLGGEWAKTMQGRTDRPDYHIAMNVCLNALPMETGAWTRRPGTKHLAFTRAGAAGRVISFEFQADHPYTVEYTDGHMRFFDGDTLVTTNDAVTVASISTANPAVVQLSSAVTWATADRAYLTGLGTLCPLLQNRVFNLTKVDTTHFSLQDGITGTNIDGSTLGWSTPSTLPTIARVLDVTTPYTAQLWKTVKQIHAQHNTGQVSVLLHSSVKPQVLSADTLPTPTTNATFSLNAANFVDGPYLDPVTGGAQVTPSALTGIVNLTISFNAYVATKAYAKGDFVTYSSVNYQSLIDQNVGNQPDTSTSDWAAVSAGVAVGANGFVGSDVGRSIRLFSEPPLWDTTVTYSAGNVVTFAGTYWTALTSMTGATPSAGTVNPNQPGVKSTTWAPTPAVARWTWGRITGLINAIDRTAGSTIGNMTAAGGLAAAFDGNTSQAIAVACTVGTTSIGSGNTLTGYVGKNFTSGAKKKIGQVTVYPTSDFGWSTQIGFNTTHIYLYASNSAPANVTDGTQLGSIDATNSYAAPVTITSSDQTTQWQYIWIVVAVTNNLQHADVFNCAVSEVQFFLPPGGATSGAGVSLQIYGSDLLYSTAIRTWRLGAYSDTTGYPTCGTYHEDRLWLSGAISNRIDSTIVAGVDGNKLTFTPTEEDGTVTDASAISYTFNADTVNPIYWMKSVDQGIMCGSLPAEWLVRATTLNEPLTPTNIQAHRYTNNGCADVVPVQTALTTVFVHRYKHKLMEYFADVFSGRFTSPNLSETAKHLTTRMVEELAFQQEVIPTIWARCADGSLIGVTYKRDNLFSSQGPTFAGWHRHTLGSGNTIESMTSAPTSDGVLDTVVMTTKDAGTGYYHVVKLTGVFEEGTDPTAAWFCDNAVAPTSMTQTTSGGITYLNLFGLWHHNGKTVSVFAGGLDCGDFAVSNGTVAVPLPAADGLLTTTYIATFTTLPVVVGFTYNSDGQLLRQHTPADSGARNGPAFGKKRRQHQYALLLQDARGISVGTDFTRLRPVPMATAGRTTIVAPTLYSGMAVYELSDAEPTYDSQLCWRVSRPYPGTVVAAGGFGETVDR